MKLLRRIRALFQKGKLDREMNEELRAHLEFQAEENELRGMAPDEARYAAQRSFGGVEQVKERARDQRGFRWLDQLVQDVRYGVRQMRRSPGFTAFAVLSLGLGIGVNVLVFSFVNASVFRPLPGVGAPEELVYRHPMWGSGIPYPEFEFCRDHNAVFSAMAASALCHTTPALRDPQAGAATVNALPETLGTVQLVSHNYFSVMQAPLQLGRGFLPEEDRAPGERPVMILSHWCWQRIFHGDPGILGRTLLVNNVLFTIIGVTRESFPFEPGMLRGGWVWVPMAMAPVLEPGIDRLRAQQDGRTRVYFFGRLKPGVTFAQAQAELMALAAHYAEIHLPKDPRRMLWPNFISHGFAFFPWNNEDVKVNVLGIFLLTGIVLLVACANVANLLLARATTRQREISVRLALGASRGRVVRQLLTESLMIAFLGAGSALLVGLWGSDVFWTWLLDLNLSPEMKRFFGLDWHMAGYVFALAAITGVIFGLVPALEGSRAGVYAALKQDGTLFGHRVSRSRLRGWLVTGQIVVSVTLLILASLAVRMVLQKTSTDFAFDPKRVCYFYDNTAPNAQAARRPQEFQRDLLERIRAIPGVTAASLGEVWDNREVRPQQLLIDGQPPAGGPRVSESLVEPGYFQTLGVPVVRGRLFTADEARNHAPVCVVSETFASIFWPGQDPLGHRLRLGGERSESEVIGVVKDGVAAIRDRKGFRAFAGDLYSPLWPDYSRLTEIWVRGESDMNAIMRAAAAEARKLDPEAQLSPRGTLQQIHDEWRKRMLLICGIAAILGGLALLLAAMGVYGVMAYAVAQRTHEIGVRMAMGASRGSITRLVLTEGLRLIAWGLMLGAGCCAAVAWFARSRLYGLSPLDPVAFGGIALVLIAVALAACWFPARNAAKIEPMMALRVE